MLNSFILVKRKIYKNNAMHRYGRMNWKFFIILALFFFVSFKSINMVILFKKKCYSLAYSISFDMTNELVFQTHYSENS